MPQAPDPARHPRPGPLAATLLTLLGLGLTGLPLFLLAGRFGTSEVRAAQARENRPRVTASRPIDGDAAVSPRASLRVELFTPTVGRGVDRDSVSTGNVRLTGPDGQRVPVRLVAAADGGSISITPEAPLVPGHYHLNVTDGLRDERGEAFLPFAAAFTVVPSTGGESFPAAYEQVALDAVVEPSKFTVLRMSPDGRLVAATADGRIFTYDVLPDGTLRQARVSAAVLRNNGGPRLVTGLAFDPTDPARLWVSHGVAALSGAPDFTGKLSVVSVEDDSYGDRIVGLPRAYKDHLNFAIVFGPDGMLYLSQGSNTSVGAPDLKWNNRPERLLTAAVLRIDPSRLPESGPLDVRTPDGGGLYDPHVSDAPLTIHATGVRSGYDLLWHSSGRLLTAVNGAGRGGNAPGVGESERNLLTGMVVDVDVTTDDTLADVTRPGSYHGHPNPLRGEQVLMGGNPTAGPDRFEIKAYRVGTRPEPHFEMPRYDFGKGYSANGLAESTADVFGGAIRGGIWVARFSGGNDLILLRPSLDGRIADAVLYVSGTTGLASPLGVCEDPRTGNLYVAEFGTGRIVLLRPVEGGTDDAVVVANPHR